MPSCMLTTPTMATSVWVRKPAMGSALWRSRMAPMSRPIPSAVMTPLVLSQSIAHSFLFFCNSECRPGHLPAHRASGAQV